jgi:hypothetical protein
MTSQHPQPDPAGSPGAPQGEPPSDPVSVILDRLREAAAAHDGDLPALPDPPDLKPHAQGAARPPVS